MESIRKRRNVIALLNIVLFIVTLWFAIKLMLDAVLIFGIANFILFVSLIKQNKKYHNAKLIYDNCILAIPLATIIPKQSSQEVILEESVISTFGVMIGSRIYMWGIKGVWGVKLSSIEIKHKHICFEFGNKTEITKIELLHGMTDVRIASDIRQRLRYETGVMATISDWEAPEKLPLRVILNETKRNEES